MDGEEVPPLASDSLTQAQQKSITSLTEKAHFAARDGLDGTLSDLLAEQAPPERNRILSALTHDDLDQLTTPLIIAAKNGHDKIVHKLVSQWRSSAALDLTGRVRFGHYLIEGASALWCAAGAGHLKIVKMLVRSGADVNQWTKMQSTPLRAACFDGRLEIVQFLIENGADMNISNVFSNGCLMIAAYNDHLSVVKYLLEKGCDPNLSANCGATALHFSAECGNLQVVKELVRAGAKLKQNQAKLTPLMAAAERCQDSVVLFLLEKFASELTREEVVTAYELLGASFANDKDKFNIGLCKVYLEVGMMRRLEEPPLVKGNIPVIPDYDSVSEASTLEELEAAFHDEERVFMMCLAMRERILGRQNLELPHHIIFRGAVHADAERFSRCLVLWRYALRLRKAAEAPMKKDLLQFAQVFCQMYSLGVRVKSEYFLEVFKTTEESLLSDVDKAARIEQLKIRVEDADTLMDNLESKMLTFLYFVALFHNMSGSLTEQEHFEVMQVLFNVCKHRPTTRNGSTLLHLACNSDTIVDDFHILDVVRFPSAACVKLLLEAGAAPDVLDAQRNTPLHHIVAYERCVQDFITLHTIIMALLEAGAHADVVNSQGKTPLETAATSVAEIFLKSVQKVSLKCLAANSIGRHKVTYKGKIPDELADFVRLHLP